MKRRHKAKLLSALMAIALVLGIAPLSAFAAESLTPAAPAMQSAQTLSVASTQKAKRTIMMYACGADLETDAAMAAYNLRQILNSNFSATDDVRFIVMTGGSRSWRLSKNYLTFPEDVSVPEDAVVLVNPDDPAQSAIHPDRKSQISNAYNQIWEAKGFDASENAGKLVLLDGDGITGAPGTAVKSEDEVMSDPDTLKAFIDYCAVHFPAEKYDLILWDHGGGPQNGFAIDEHFSYDKDYGKPVDHIMSFSSIVDALAHNKVTDADSDGVLDGRFDFVDFDACLMGSVELALVMADYADYYIASAETEPGYGQYYGPRTGRYTGWLDELGKNPGYDTFALGKVIVNDFYEFYEKETGDGSNQDGTLAVFDLQKMIAPETGFIAALTELAATLKAQATSMSPEGQLLFYDELRSFFNAYDYGDMQLFDLGEATAMLGVVSSEVSGDDIDPTGEFVNKNAYTALADTFSRMLQPDSPVTENAFMYARGTREIKTDGRYYRAIDEFGEHVACGTLFTSGLSLYFPGKTNVHAPIEYFWALDPVLESMPVKNDGRYAFLRAHEEVVADYGLILLMGRTLDQMLNYAGDDFEVASKDDIDADEVMGFWRSPNGKWANVMLEYFAKRPDGETGTVNWLRTLIGKQIVDAVFAGNVTSSKINLREGEGYRMRVTGANKRAIESVERNLVVELPALKEYMLSLSEEDRANMESLGALSVGSTKATLGDQPENPTLLDQIIWYNATGGIWDVGTQQTEWYAVKDASGNLHVASVYQVDGGWIYVPALIGSREYAEDKGRLGLLEFHRDDDDAASCALTSVYYLNSSTGAMAIDPKQFTHDIAVMPILYIKSFFGDSYLAPISRSPFTISSANMESITLEYTDIANIPDIADIDGDGKVLDSIITIADIYGHRIDVTDKARNPTDPELTHIELASVTPGQYVEGSGKEPVPTVVFNGETLREGVDYTWKKDYVYDTETNEYIQPAFTKAGSYDIQLIGTGLFTGKAYATFDVSVIAAPLTDISKMKATLSGTSFAYTGKAIKPAVKVKGVAAGCYTVKYANNENAGTAKVTITGKAPAGYAGTIVKPFKITKAANPLAVKGRTATVKASALKRSAQKLAATKVLKFANKGKGKLTYTKVSGAKKIAIDKKTGQVTLKKGLKAGTYTVLIKMRAAGGANYKAATKAAAFKVRVQ